MALFHLSNRAKWEIHCDRTFWHAMDMKFSHFLKEFKEIRIDRKERDNLGCCPGTSHPGAASRSARQNARGGRCLITTAVRRLNIGFIMMFNTHIQPTNKPFE